MAIDRPGKRSDDATGQKATDARLTLRWVTGLYPERRVLQRWMLVGKSFTAIRRKRSNRAPRLVKERPDSPQSWLELGMVYLTAAQPKHQTKRASGRTA